MNNQINDAKKIWQDQPLEGMTMSLQQVHERIDKLSRIVRRRNLIGGFACITVLLGFSYFFAALNQPSEGMERIGAALTAIGAGYIMYQLAIGKMRRQTAIAETQAQASMSFYRSELQRQRDFHQGVWFWSRMVVFAPGPVIFLIGMVKANPAFSRGALIEGSIALALLVWAIPRNLSLAKRFQQELDALDSAGC
ncbi:MAG TPA: hypothetical protein VMB18_15585 [Terriglobales bacterium]|nr:hypothetical protein [Terriglobales bacterium]